ncbi:MAG TPA: RraA family protein [Solirubrobacteraceae bacterium]|jgi:regulator of RNase E activity RraA
MTASELVERLLAVEVSALCDADKTLPVVDPAIRAIVPDVRTAGPALTVVAEDDHLPVFSALLEAEPGDVLVVATNGGTAAVLGELFASEARRRGLAGVVIDGRCRDVQGLRRVGLPIFARGTIPRSGTVVSRAPLGQPITCGGVAVARGDLVFADDDGVVIAPADRIAAALEGAEAIARAEGAILQRVAAGEELHALTSYRAHVARLDAGEASALTFEAEE